MARSRRQEWAFGTLADHDLLDIGTIDYYYEGGARRAEGATRKNNGFAGRQDRDLR